MQTLAENVNTEWRAEKDAQNQLEKQASAERDKKDPNGKKDTKKNNDELNDE